MAEPDHALNFSEKHLAPGWASTDGPQRPASDAGRPHRLFDLAGQLAPNAQHEMLRHQLQAFRRVATI